MLKFLRNLLVVLVLVAAFYAVARNWNEVTLAITHLSWQSWVPAFLLLPVAILCSTLSWQAFLDELGEPVGARRGAQIFLVGQLGKYLPGSVWAYVLQIELGRRAGLARARVFTATVFSLVVVVVAALLAGSLAIPTLVEDNPQLGALRWLYLVLPVALVCLHPWILTRAVRFGFRILRRPNPEHPIRKRAVLTSLAWALTSYAVFGTHLWLLLNDTDTAGSNPVGLDALALCIGTMALALISGLFFFMLPSGAGVRELIIVAGVSPFVGTGTAIGLAAVSRVFLTIADLVTAGIAAGLAWLEQRRYGPYHGDPGTDNDED